MEGKVAARICSESQGQSSSALISEGWQCLTAVKHLIPLFLAFLRTKGPFWEKGWRSNVSRVALKLEGGWVFVINSSRWVTAEM